MRIRRTLSLLVAAGLVAGTGVVLAPAASAAPPPAGTSSLATLLAADGHTFDRSWRDFDILDQAVLAVLAAKPSSPVAVLADGTVPLTAFLPTDRAFQVLAADLTHRWYGTEAQVFNALAGAVGVDAIEQVLFYHVVPGVTIDSAAALASNGAVLTTAQGSTFTVQVLSKRCAIVRLRDQDRNDIDPFLIRGRLDLNAGNVQIAHAITFVLRPADL
ncbi:fasciclin domain-containing protein [Cellulomonas sp. URHD0024]|uniref:fasciclin domain-containing protein n=1 Tax=Cellulomonas sp. URHD0024 TaxID=1302620 RepID=UPI00047F7254|nr:fasciclin domain-containing protein [Cellulomonas sp. URHD0024]